MPRPAPALTETAGGPSLRAQNKLNERKIHEAELQQLEKAKPEDRAAMKEAFTAARAERARTFATMVCSEAGDVYKPIPGGNNKGQILKSFYSLIGERGREQAAKDGKPFTQKYAEGVRLSREDVRAQREKLMKMGFTDADFKEAIPLLSKHIARERFMDQRVIAFMASREFLRFGAIVEQMMDKVEDKLEDQRRAIDDKDHALLLDHLADVEKRKQRRVTNWTESVQLTNVDHNHDGNDDTKTTKYTVVGGKLLPVDENQD